MKYTIDKHEHYAVLSLLEERLDQRIAPSLKSQFVVMQSEGIVNIVLDLGATHFIDSSGLSAILVGNRLCTGHNGIFVLCTLNENVQKMLDITHLTDVLNILPSREQALDAVYMNLLQEEILQEEDEDDDLDTPRQNGVHAVAAAGDDDDDLGGDADEFDDDDDDWDDDDDDLLGDEDGDEEDGDLDEEMEEIGEDPDFDEFDEEDDDEEDDEDDDDDWEDEEGD